MFVCMGRCVAALSHPTLLDPTHAHCSSRSFHTGRCCCASSLLLWTPIANTFPSHSDSHQVWQIPIAWQQFCVCLCLCLCVSVCLCVSMCVCVCLLSLSTSQPHPPSLSQLIKGNHIKLYALNRASQDRWVRAFSLVALHNSTSTNNSAK